MKKLLTVTCLAGLLSIPSVVFAEASWYGVLGVGVRSDTITSVATQEDNIVTPGVKDDVSTDGLASFGSRWGVQGSSEVSEGLTAVFRYEDGLNATNASTVDDERLSYVGLSGGFGSITAGRVPSASYGTFGAITDGSAVFGSSETDGSRISNVIAYAVSVGSISLQANVVMKKGSGSSEFITGTLNPANAELITKTTTAKKVKWDETGKKYKPSDKPVDDIADVTLPESTSLLAKEDKLADAFEFGVTVNDIMENGKIAFAHKKWDTNKFAKLSSNYIAGEYGIGGMKFYLGAAQHKSEDNIACQYVKKGESTDETVAAVFGKTTEGVETTTPYSVAAHSTCVGKKQTDSTTFAGIRGSVGDTGVSYFFQARSKKSKGTLADYNPATKAGITKDADNEDIVTPVDTITNQLIELDDPEGNPVPANKTNPWVLGLSKTLGGGASLNFEFADDDIAGDPGKYALWLSVSF